MTHFFKLLQDAKDKHLPVRKIKFNKYKHKKNNWITRGMLRSIKTKNKLYKVLPQTDTEDVEAFEFIKIRFNRFHNILRQSIKEAKRIYFVRTFERFKYDIKQTWSTINETLHRKKRNPFQVYSLTTVKCYGIQLKSPTRLINIS